MPLFSPGVVAERMDRRCARQPPSGGVGVAVGAGVAVEGGWQTQRSITGAFRRKRPAVPTGAAVGAGAAVGTKALRTGPGDAGPRVGTGGGPHGTAGVTTIGRAGKAVGVWPTEKRTMRTSAGAVPPSAVI